MDTTVQVAGASCRDKFRGEWGYWLRSWKRKSVQEKKSWMNKVVFATYIPRVCYKTHLVCCTYTRQLMNIYQLAILVLIVIILVYELVPATQSVLKRAMRKCRRRARNLRGFIDDDDYNVSREFSTCPFTLREYVSTQDSHTDETKSARARALCDQGWGGLYHNGPDVIQPGTHWWTDGECSLRDVPLDSHVAHIRARHVRIF